MNVFATYLVLTLTVVTSASVVTFEKSPDVIHTVLTKQMTLSCSIKDSAPSGSLIGRSLMTPTNVKYVTSILVLRNGKEIATITPFSPATALQANDYWDRLNVTGSIPGQAGEQGRLTLTWLYPDDLEAGNYSCEVNGINAIGHNVMLSAELVMGVRHPDMSDIIQHVHDQGMQIDLQKIENQKALDKISDLELKLASQKSEIMAAMNSRLDDVMNQLNNSRHYENGTVECDNSNTGRDWTVVGNFKEKNTTVQFSYPYSSTPIIHVSPVRLNQYHRNSDSYPSNYWIEVVDVSRTEFTIVCKASSRSSYIYIENLQVSWISIA